MRRHLDTFGGREFSIPAKTKSVPVHTGRFIVSYSYRPNQSLWHVIHQLTSSYILDSFHNKSCRAKLGISYWKDKFDKLFLGIRLPSQGPKQCQ